MSALEAEIVESARHPLSSNACMGQPRTLYIGGGTPSVLPLSAFRRILTALRANGFLPSSSSRSSSSVPFEAAAWDEFTVEVNPEDIVEKGEAFVEGLMELGVTRISMGVQSFDDRILKWMNRRHNAERALKAYAILENAGMENISIDLIYGMPQLTMKGWQETLDRALGISSRGQLPAHISAYQLSIEPGSALARLMASGRFSEAGEELCSAQYRQLCETLAAAGYHHYEISNFALPGREAIHNSAYWDKVPYLGLGPGAHSYLIGTPAASAAPASSVASVSPATSAAPSASAASVAPAASVSSVAPAASVAPSSSAASVAPAASVSSVSPATSAAPAEPERIRRWNLPDLRAYIAAGKHFSPAPATSAFAAVRGQEILTSEEHREERIMLGLRTDAGVDENYLRGLDAEGHVLVSGQSIPVDRMLAEGALEPVSSASSETRRLRIPESHLFVSDDIIAELI